MPSLFNHYPDRPGCEECQNAHLILQYAHDASSAFLDSFEKVRRARNARGTPTDEEQDLLRAMLVFSTAGLDSMVKQLIKNALPRVINISPGAASMFKKFIVRQLKRGDPVNHNFLAEALSTPFPRRKLIKDLVDDLTRDSLQSVDQLLNAAAYFDIKSVDICRDLDRLRNIFKTRNQIVHEMDIDMEQANRNRQPRAKRFMVDSTNQIFSVSNNFLINVVRQTAV